MTSSGLFFQNSEFSFPATEHIKTFFHGLSETHSDEWTEYDTFKTLICPFKVDIQRHRIEKSHTFFCVCVYLSINIAERWCMWTVMTKQFWWVVVREAHCWAMLTRCSALCPQLSRLKQELAQVKQELQYKEMGVETLQEWVFLCLCVPGPPFPPTATLLLPTTLSPCCSPPSGPFPFLFPLLSFINTNSPSQFPLSFDFPHVSLCSYELSDVV